METLPLPEVGQWYCDQGNRKFMVVARDDATAAVEVQYFDGTVEEVDLPDWPELAAAWIAAPEDWSGPFDDLVRDDMGDTERPGHPEDFDGPWNELDRAD
ncbi:MAG: DUF6763 family protein [Gammaproteobacteria bacterium]